MHTTMASMYTPAEVQTLVQSLQMELINLLPSQSPSASTTAPATPSPSATMSPSVTMSPPPLPFECRYLNSGRGWYNYVVAHNCAADVATLNAQHGGTFTLTCINDRTVPDDTYSTTGQTVTVDILALEDCDNKKSAFNDAVSGSFTCDGEGWIWLRTTHGSCGAVDALNVWAM